MNLFLYLKTNGTNLMKYVDIFGYNPELFVFGEKKFRTMFGGFLSIFYFALLLVMFLFLGSSMINRENPETNVSQQYKANPSASKVGREDYFFMFGMQLWKWPNGHFFDSSIYTVKMTDQLGRDLNFERCTLDHLPEDRELNEFFQTAHGSNISELLCLSKDSELMLHGTFANINDYNSIHISISPCQNKTADSNSSVICKSQAEINSALGKGNFAYYSVDVIIDLLQKNPVKRVGLDYFIETSTSVRKQITRFLSTSYIDEDVGWIVKNRKETAYTVMDRDRESMSLIEPELEGKSEILYMNIRKSVYEKMYTRSYMKIQSVLALMGGFLKILHMIFCLFSKPVVQKLFHDDITNLIYNFELDKKEPKIFKNFKSMILSNSEESRSTKIKRSMSTLLSSFYQRNKKLFARAFTNEEAPLNMTFLEEISSVFSKNLKTKVKQRRKAIEKIQRKLDLTFMFEKFNEIEKIKMLLLNEEQYRLFEYLPKPKIQNDLTINYSPEYKDYKKRSIHEKSFYFTEDYDKAEKAQKAEDSLRQILSKEIPSEIDLKLISLLSPELKDLLIEEGIAKKKQHDPKIESEHFPSTEKLIEEDINIDKRYFGTIN